MFRALVISTGLLFALVSPATAQQRGSLELLIAANSDDDAAAIKDARAYIDDPANKAAIAKCQKDGLPPPGLRTPNGKGLAKYQIDLGHDPGRHATHAEAKKALATAFEKLQVADGEAAERQALKALEEELQRFKQSFQTRSVKCFVGYRWVQLGPEALRLLNLDNAAQNDPMRNATWKSAAANRDKASTLSQGNVFNTSRLLCQGALFYSRACQNAKLTAAERKQIGVEYFVLVRAAEFDPADPKPTKPIAAIGSQHLISVVIDEKLPKSPGLSVQLNAEGKKLLADLTGKNAPTNVRKLPDGTIEVGEPSVRRHLAIVVDGRVVSLPTIMAPVTGGRFVIGGHFTLEALEQLAKKLQPGP